MSLNVMKSLTCITSLSSVDCKSVKTAAVIVGTNSASIGPFRFKSALENWIASPGKCRVVDVVGPQMIAAIWGPRRRTMGLMAGIEAKSSTSSSRIPELYGSDKFVSPPVHSSLAPRR